VCVLDGVCVYNLPINLCTAADLGVVFLKKELKCILISYATVFKVTIIGRVG